MGSNFEDLMTMNLVVETDLKFVLSFENKTFQFFETGENPADIIIFVAITN